MEGRYRTRSATTKPTGKSKLVAGMKGRTKRPRLRKKRRIKREEIMKKNAILDGCSTVVL